MQPRSKAVTTSLKASDFNDPLTGQRKKLFQQFKVDPTKTGQTWIFNYINPHTFEFEANRTQLVINCAGNCNGIDGVIRIAMTGTFSVDPKKNISGTVNAIELGTWFNNRNGGASNLELVPASFSFSNGTALIKNLRSNLMGAAHDSRSEQPGQANSPLFPQQWWLTPFETRLLV